MVFIINFFSSVLEITIQHHQNRWQIFAVCFLILYLWTIPCFSNFQMAVLIVNSLTHVPISQRSIPQTSNRNVRCDCTALIWNIHLICEVLCCHLPCANSMASIIEDLGWGRLRPQCSAPCSDPKQHGQSERAEALFSVMHHFTRWDMKSRPVKNMDIFFISELQSRCITLNEYWPHKLSTPSRRIPWLAVNNPISPLEKTVVYPNSPSCSCVSQ